MHERENALKEWLKHIISPSDFSLKPLAGDASFRRYYRIQYNGLTQVVMDAPPEKEDLKPFIHLKEVLTQAQVSTPDIIAMNREEGFLLLSDLGDTLLLNELRADSADNCYKMAIDTLLLMQHCPKNDPQIPSFDKTFMLKEMSLCLEWFLKKYLSLELSETEQLLMETTMSWIADEVAKQPTVFIHRDYHSRNIMLTNSKPSSLAVIDFQDAMYGPLTYDLVSLLKDCYISWPREDVLHWVHYFYEHNPTAHFSTLEDLVRSFDLCGLQRHLKILGVFCRLYLRDGKAGYLADLPLTLKYVLDCAERYEELHPFLHVLQERVCLP